MAWKCYIYECYYKYVQEGDCGLPDRPNLFNLPKATEIQKFLTSLSQVLHHALHSHTTHTSSDVFGLDGMKWIETYWKKTGEKIYLENWNSRILYLPKSYFHYT